MREYLDDFVLAYLDDVLIFSKTYEEHVQYVQLVLNKLHEKALPVKLSKCEFYKYKIAFLGYLVLDKGMEPNPEKVNSVNDWPIPKNVRDVQAFLGLVNYYYMFIEGFSGIATPMTALTKKDVLFIWSHQCEEAFKELKRRLATTPILTIFDPEREAILETDASDYAIGACLA